MKTSTKSVVFVVCRRAKKKNPAKSTVSLGFLGSLGNYELVPELSDWFPGRLRVTYASWFPASFHDDNTQYLVGWFNFKIITIYLQPATISFAFTTQA